MKKLDPTLKKLDTLSLFARLLGLIERLLPAFLVAWNNKLRQDNKQLELKLELKELEDRVAEKRGGVREKDAKIVIDSYLDSVVDRGERPRDQ